MLTSRLPISTSGRFRRHRSTLWSPPRRSTGLTHQHAWPGVRPSCGRAVRSPSFKRGGASPKAMTRSSRQARRATPAGLRTTIPICDRTGRRTYDRRAMTWQTQNWKTSFTDAISALENTARPRIAICWARFPTFWHSRRGAVPASSLACPVSSIPSLGGGSFVTFCTIFASPDVRDENGQLESARDQGAWRIVHQDGIFLVMARSKVARQEDGPVARTIRFPEGLRSRIAADADRCGRSFEGQAIAILRRHYGEDVDIAPAPAEILGLAAASLAGVSEREIGRLTRRLRESESE